jgi:hypothetical protein
MDLLFSIVIVHFVGFYFQQLQLSLLLELDPRRPAAETAEGSDHVAAIYLLPSLLERALLRCYDLLALPEVPLRILKVPSPPALLSSLPQQSRLPEPIVSQNL